MINSIISINKSEVEEILSSNGVYAVVIEGKSIDSWEDYWNAVAKAFRFPKLPEYMKNDYHTYYDLMTDLSWLDVDKICVIINDYNSFFMNNRALRDEIIKDFNEFLLPFWQYEDKEFVVGGSGKEFNVYLVME